MLAAILLASSLFFSGHRSSDSLEGPARSLLAAKATSSPTDVAITPAISELAATLIAKTHVPGLSVGVVRLNGTTVTTESQAWGNMTEDGQPTTTDTLFGAGSCSKAFLAASMGILIDDFAQGRNVSALPNGVSKLDWNSKVRDLLPDWGLQDKWASEKVTVMDILSHVSGLTRHDLSYERDETPETMLRKLPHLKPGYELRERWSYNNIMYVMAAHIISKYTGVSYRDFVQARIFDPLGMDVSTFSQTKANATGLFSQIWSTGHRIPFWFEDSRDFTDAPGGVITNSRDMSKWIAMLLNGGVDPITNKTIIPAAQYKAIVTSYAVIPQQGVDPPAVGASPGWNRFNYRGHQILEHSGGIPGFLTEVYLLPASGLGVVSFINTDGSYDALQQVPLRIIDNLLGLTPGTESLDTPPPRSPRTPVNGTGCANTTALAAFAGTYSNPGYGAFTLCTPSSTSPACAPVLANFTAVAGGLTDDALYGAFPRLWTSHIRFKRECDEKFRLTMGTPFVHGYGKDTKPFLYMAFSPEADVECEVRDGKVVGCGWMNTEEHNGPRSTEGSAEERADVWFTRADA